MYLHCVMMIYLAIPYALLSSLSFILNEDELNLPNRFAVPPSHYRSQRVLTKAITKSVKVAAKSCSNSESEASNVKEHQDLPEVEDDTEDEERDAIAIKLLLSCASRTENNTVSVSTPEHRRRKRDLIKEPVHKNMDRASKSKKTLGSSVSEKGLTKPKSKKLKLEVSSKL